MPFPRFETIGCFSDNQSAPAIATLEHQDSILDGDYKTRQDAIDKCYKATKKREFHVFAVQDGGMCSASGTAHQTFHQHGRSNTCEAGGKGGLGANQVYYITGKHSALSKSRNCAFCVVFIERRSYAIGKKKDPSPYLKEMLNIF